MTSSNAHDCTPSCDDFQQHDAPDSETHDAIAVGCAKTDGRAPSTRRLRELFDLLTDIPTGKHNMVLDVAGATPRERSEVLALLRADMRHSSLLHKPVFDTIRSIEDYPLSERHLHGRQVGEYRLEQVIGRGGSAVVFRGRHTSNPERIAAIKLIHKGLFSPTGLLRFEREAQILAQLDHPDIAALFDSGYAVWGMPYLVLEHVDGTDIIAYANRHNLDVRQRVAMLIRVGSALSAAHARQIVHCDIKPENILVTATGATKILDFGIGRVAEEEQATATVEVALTPRYAAPEQYDGGSISARTDVYSLGVLASELLIGVRLGPDAAWPGDANRDPHRGAWQRLPRVLRHALRKALASNPRDRFADAGLFAEALRAVLLCRRKPWSDAVAALRMLGGFVQRNVSVAAILLCGLLTGALLKASLLPCDRTRNAERAAHAVERDIQGVRADATVASFALRPLERRPTSCEPPAPQARPPIAHSVDIAVNARHGAQPSAASEAPTSPRAVGC